MPLDTAFRLLWRSVLLLAVLATAPARADIITYEFRGNILEAPSQLADLAYGPGVPVRPLVVTLVLNSGIAPIITESPGVLRAANYNASVVSLLVELSGVTLATSSAATTGLIIQTFDRYQEFFNVSIPNPATFTSGPVRGLSPLSLELQFRATSPRFPNDLSLPVPFPALAGDFTLRFGSPATQPVYSILTQVSTTSVVPVPAAVWLFGPALGVLGVLRRRRSQGAGLSCRACP